MLCLSSGLLFMVACDSPDYSKNKDNNTTPAGADKATAEPEHSAAATDATAGPAVSTVAPTTATAKVKKMKASISWTSEADSRGAVVKLEKDKEGVYSRAEVMPEFPGGQEALQKFVEENVNYEQAAIDNTEGTVRVSFIVDENGKVSKPIVIGQSPDKELKEEALRVVREMPAWRPGTVKGKTVKTRLELPITFLISEV